MIAPRSLSGHKLAGSDLVRLVYLDEAGTSASEPTVVVAGVAVHGDREWIQVDNRIAELVDRYVQPPYREKFVFHAKDIFHGTGYFDRNSWPREKRWEVLAEIVKIPAQLNLPVFFGKVDKDKFQRAVSEDGAQEVGKKEESDVTHMIAFADCATSVERWLRQYASDELGMLIAEDADRVKRLIKRIVGDMRAKSLPQKILDQFPDLHLTKIIDTVHFAAKPEARALQIADACAFVLRRFYLRTPEADQFTALLMGPLKWQFDHYQASASDQRNGVAS